jgi:hypothetical protein
MPGGDHLIAVCTVHTLGAAEGGRPLLFFRSDFHRVAEPFDPTIPEGGTSA